MATFGKTTDGGSSSASSAPRVWVSQATPAQNGVAVTAGHGRIWLSASGSVPVKFVIYADSGGVPGALLAESDVLTVTSTAEGVRDFVFSGANRIAITGGTPYWIGLAWDDPGSPSLNVSRDSTAGLRYEQAIDAWPTLPNPYGSPTANNSGPIDAWVDYDTAIPIGPVTDSGAGTDTPTVAKTELRAVADSGVGTQAVTTFVPYSATTDGGTGTEAIAIEVLVDVAAADSGTGTDTIQVADFVTKGVTETGTGTEAISLVQTNFVQLTDSGVGTETRTLLQSRQITDSGVASDVIAGQGDHPLTDSGVGTDSIRVTVIPFTQVLPLVEGTIYDLVVVARIQQASGPPTFIEIDPIEWKSLTYSNTLSQPQELTASCLISSVTEPVLQRLRRLHELATELWLYRDGELVFAGPLQGWQTSGENLTIRCQGLLAYLRGMVINSDLRFKNVDQFTIVKTMVDQWQALEYGNFGIDTSAVGLSGQTRSEDFLKIELHNIGQRVEELGKLANGFDTEIDPASRRLQLWSPRKGVDRSTGEDAIVFDARNITSGDILCSVAGGDLASEAYGTSGSAGSDDAKISTASNAELRSRYGRTAVTQTWSDVKDQATLDLYTQALLDARAEVLMVPGPRCRITPDADLTDYDVGDNIAYDLASQLGISGAFRIRKQTVTVSSTGQESVSLEFV